MLSHTMLAEAAERLRGRIRRTPVLALDAGELPGGAPVVLKLEFLQHSGSFKARGAFNRMLTADVPAAGVAAASGGNHGAAVAYAARALQQAATIFVPGPTSAAKLERIASYGAVVRQGGADYAEALDRCRVFQAETGALDVHAYDEEAVLAGQGTIGLEMRREALTHVLVAVGGGGLIGGMAAALDGSGVQVVGVEPEACPTFRAARLAGAPVDVGVAGVAADSLGARRLGSLSFDWLRRAGAESVLVSDAAIRGAQGWLWERLRVIAEPGGATALAALLSGAWLPPSPACRVGVVLCGANADPGLVSRETFRPVAA